MKTTPIYAIGATAITAAMSGVAYATPPKEGEIATLHYTDGTKESGKIPCELAAKIRAYVAWQLAGGQEAEAPSIFAITSAVQESRKITRI